MQLLTKDLIRLKTNSSKDYSLNPFHILSESITNNIEKIRHMDSSIIEMNKYYTNDQLVYIPLFSFLGKSHQTSYHSPMNLNYLPINGFPYKHEITMVNSTVPVQSILSRHKPQLSPILQNTHKIAPSSFPKQEGEKCNNTLDVPNSILKDGIGHRKRNVYKSIIRNMNSLVRKNSKGLMRQLIKAGYSEEEIRSSFEKIGQWNEVEKRTGIPKRSQSRVEELVGKRTVYTYVMQETLKMMLNKLREGVRGRIRSHNIVIYVQTCEEYYKRASKLTKIP